MNDKKKAVFHQGYIFWLLGLIPDGKALQKKTWWQTRHLIVHHHWHCEEKWQKLCCWNVYDEVNRLHYNRPILRYADMPCTTSNKNKKAWQLFLQKYQYSTRLFQATHWAVWPNATNETASGSDFSTN